MGFDLSATQRTQKAHGTTQSWIGPETRLDLCQQLLPRKGHIEAGPRLGIQQPLESLQHSQRVLVGVQVRQPETDRIAVEARLLSTRFLAAAVEVGRALRYLEDRLLWIDLTLSNPGPREFAAVEEEGIYLLQTPSLDLPGSERALRPLGMVLSYQWAAPRHQESEVPHLKREEQTIQMNDFGLEAQNPAVQTTGNPPGGQPRRKPALDKLVTHSGAFDHGVSAEPLDHSHLSPFCAQGFCPPGEGMETVQNLVGLALAGKMTVVDEDDPHGPMSDTTLALRLIGCDEKDRNLVNAEPTSGRGRAPSPGSDAVGGPHSRPARRAKEALRRLAQRGFEEIWAAAFRASSRRLPAASRIVASEEFGGEGDALVVAPHPDDEVAGCAGAILAHRRAGDRVQILCVTDGRRSTAYGLDPEVMAREREKEIKSAATRLDAELHFLRLPEGQWSTKTFVASFVDLVSRTSPSWIYAPSALDFHPEHRRVSEALASALPTLSHPPRIRVYEIQVPLTPRPANLFLSGVPRAQVEEAIRCHRTQVGAVLCSLRRRRYAASQAGLQGYAEAFWELGSRRYAELHREPPPGEAFRSLRYWAFTDPLAYWTGRRERARWSDCEDSLA